MAGGTWIDQNKVRPGVYINYKSSPATLSTMGERGTVAIARQLDWGETGKFYIIEDPSDCAQMGHAITDNEMLFLRQILLGSNRTNGATKVLIWALESYSIAVKAKGDIGDLHIEAITAGSSGNKISVSVAENSTNYDVVTSVDGTVKDTQTVATIAALTANAWVSFSGTGDTPAFSVGSANLTGGGDAAAKATATLGNLVATARYVGTYGNRLSVVVTAGEGSSFIVQTLLDGQLVDSQTVTAISGLSANAYITWSGTGALSANPGVDLAGGANGDLTATAYSNFLSTLENEKFDVVIYDGTNVVTQGAFVDFVKRLSNQEGIKCQTVISNASSPDNECVINVYPHAVTLTDGTELAPSKLTWWVGGASAGANAFESLTYAAYPDAIAIDPVLTSSQQEAAINAGKFALIAQFDKIQVLTDINSFTTFAVEKGRQFRKNRVIRTIFGLCNDIYKTFALYYIGAVHNDEDGRASLKAEILNLMDKYQGNRALQNVSADDVTVLQGTDSDAVVIEIFCQPVDSIEKIYINITIS